MVPSECSVVRIGSRPRGFSVRRDTSISPHCVSSSVRGIGVAVITSTSVFSPLPPSNSRWSTPNRCCSSITATARSRYVTESWNSAWVPTTICTDPSASSRSSLRPRAPLHRPGQQGDRHRRQVRQGAKVLAGEHLGGRHQRGLGAGLHRAQHGQQRHQGLAGADIALQQPQHAPRSAPRSASISASAFTCERVGAKPNRSSALARSAPSPCKARPGRARTRPRTTPSATWPASNSS